MPARPEYRLPDHRPAERKFSARAKREPPSATLQTFRKNQFLGYRRLTSTGLQVLTSELSNLTDCPHVEHAPPDADAAGGHRRRRRARYLHFAYARSSNGRRRDDDGRLGVMALDFPEGAASIPGIEPRAGREPRVRGSENERGSSTALIPRTRSQTRRPHMYRVLLLNDDYTTQDFVVLVLQRYFNKSEPEARRIMLLVHNHGVGECGVYTYEVAETKVTLVMEYARQHQHPLQCIMEKK
jgi:ATP-dependent Clp protease adaptor protein ClpS